MRRKYNKGGKVPSKFKGFSSLPENVQRQMNPSLAKKYRKGGVMSKDEYDDLVTKLGGQPLPAKLDSLYKGQTLPTNLDSVIKLKGQVLPKSYNNYVGQVLPTTNKKKNEGGTFKDTFKEITTPTEEITKGAGLAGLAGATLGAASDDGDATTYKAGEVGGDILKGAAAGAAFGPLGIALGGIGAGVAGLVNRNKAKKEEEKQKKEQRKQQQELTKQNIEQNLQRKETQEEEERIKRSTDALANMAPMGSEGMTPTPMMRKYGGKVGMPPPPPGFMYDKNGNLVRTNRALDIREKGGLIAKKYSIGQMR